MITKIRIDNSDGTYYQLTDPKEIKRWVWLIKALPGFPFDYNLLFSSPKWEQGAIDLHQEYWADPYWENSPQGRT
jgi:hypothetical protein